MERITRSLRYYKQYINKTDTVCLTYYLILAIVPVITLMMLFINFIGLDRDIMVSVVSKAFTDDATSFIVDLFMDRSSSTLSLITICTSTYVSSQGTYRMILTVDKMFHVRQEMSAFSLRVHAIFDIILIMLLIIGAILGIYFMPDLFEHFNLHIFSGATTIFAILVIYVILVVIFKVVPSIRIRWRDTLLGALCTTVLWCAITLAFRIYLSVVNMSNVYGTFATVALLLMIIDFYSQALYFGFAVNALKYVE